MNIKTALLADNFSSGSAFFCDYFTQLCKNCLFVLHLVIMCDIILVIFYIYAYKGNV